MPGSAFDISFQFTMIENRLLRKVLAFEEKWSQHFWTLHRVKLRDTRRSRGIVTIRESRRDCWTVHLDNIGRAKGNHKILVKKCLWKTSTLDKQEKLKDKKTKFSDGFWGWQQQSYHRLKRKLLLKQEEKWRDRSVKVKQEAGRYDGSY
jgi:hypothetical protein